MNADRTKNPTAILFLKGFKKHTRFIDSKCFSKARERHRTTKLSTLSLPESTHLIIIRVYFSYLTCLFCFQTSLFLLHRGKSRKQQWVVKSRTLKQTQRSIIFDQHQKKTWRLSIFRAISWFHFRCECSDAFSARTQHNSQDHSFFAVLTS